MAEEEPKPEEPKPPVEEEEDEDLPDCKKRKPEKIILETDGRKGDAVPKKINCDKGKTEDEDNKPPPETSRDYRIYKAMNTKEWGAVCECHGSRDQAVLDLLSITITTIMLLAIDNKPEDPQLRWAANCLENVRDDNGNVPPNLRCILNLIYTKIPKEDPDADGEPTTETHEAA